MQVLDFPVLDIVTPPLEGDDDMAKKDPLDGIYSRLDKIETALRLRPMSKGRISLALEWIINHKATSLILAIVLCAAGIYGGAHYKYHLDHKDDDFNADVDKRISKELEKQEGCSKPCIM